LTITIPLKKDSGGAWQLEASTGLQAAQAHAGAKR
jgi:hypothetical protein